MFRVIGPKPMGQKYILLMMYFFLCPLAGCGESFQQDRPPAQQPLGRVKLYTFSPDDQYFLRNAQPHILPEETTLKEALISLGRHLSDTYFHTIPPDTRTGILFEPVKIQGISYKNSHLKVAVVNMIDNGEYALKYFFQGSTGGQTTFSMIGATLIQPQLNPPLIDGLILLYNGEALPELDHINLSGILTPRLVRFVAKRAIYNTKMESASLLIRPVVAGPMPTSFQRRGGR
jgi:hypothetical protein